MKRSANTVVARVLGTFVAAVAIPVVAGGCVKDFTGGVLEKNCDVHGVPMERTCVPLSYGLIGYRAGYLEARKAFPHGEENADGGCMRPVSGLPNQALIFVCPACREARVQWEQIHQDVKVLNREK